jgi:glycosyltransferase involved in cell wall biosynthesis
MDTPDYIIITPARNEAAHVQKTIDSIVAQTLRPSRWIIVNDGSSDDTAKIIRAAAAQHSWITVVDRPDRGRREAGGGVIATFYDGYKLIAEHPWEFVVKLDGDLSFGPDYFKDCLAEFGKNPKLGIGGGACCLEINGQVQVEFPNDPSYHVRGPTKLYRRACWQDIGGLVKAPGWDGIDEIKANMHGWQTRTFPQIRLVHHRPTGSAYGSWTDSVKCGLANYITGYHPVFIVCKCAKRFLAKPFSLAPLALFTGFLKGYVKKMPQVDDKELIHYLRQQQWRALTFRKNLWYQ